MTLRDKADDLNISTHTLRNWQKRNESTSRGSRDLVSRANKLNSHLLTFPSELLISRENRQTLQDLRDRLLEQPLNTAGRILLFTMYYLQFRNLLTLPPGKRISLREIISQCSTAGIMKKELQFRLKELPPEEQVAELDLPDDFYSLFKSELLKETDLPGLIYQSLRKEGNRSRQGAWFTPVPVVDSMIRPYIRKKTGIFDPCCGSGLFLCRFALLKGDSSPVIRGMDSDPLSVFLTRVNLFCLIPGWDDFMSIQETDSLKAGSWNLDDETLVATNPPWGAHMGKGDKKEMSRRYPEIKSGESSSLFIRRCIEELPSAGSASFLLPESLFYVQSHKDIRTYLLNHAPPVRLTDRGRLFKGVYTSVVSCDFKKESRHRKAEQIHINRSSEKHALKDYRRNPENIINYHCSSASRSLIRKIRNGNVGKLSKNCLWLLGVVTGDNNRFISSGALEGAVPILTGKELRPFYSDAVCNYLILNDGPLQQSRALKDYAREKLLYRFIGYRPVFTLDRTGLVTLNSANALIPPDEDDLEELAFWYNSTLFRFIWYNQYRSVKMLRRHLEELPLPLWDKNEKRELRRLVQMAEKRQDILSQMDELIFSHFKLTQEERNIVISQS